MIYLSSANRLRLLQLKIVYVSCLFQLFKYHQSNIDKVNGWGKKLRKNRTGPHLVTVLQPHDIQSCINPTPTYHPETKIRPISRTQEINKKFESNEAPGIDDMSPMVYLRISSTNVWR